MTDDMLKREVANALEAMAKLDDSPISKLAGLLAKTPTLVLLFIQKLFIMCPTAHKHTNETVAEMLEEINKQVFEKKQ